MWAEYRSVFNFEQCVARNFGNVFDLLAIRGHRATIYASYLSFARNPESPSHDLLGVRYVISPRRLDLPLLREEEGLFLHERPTALPLFRMFDRQTGLRRPVRIHAVDWKPNSVSVRLEIEESGALEFAQPYYPGWALVDDGDPHAVRSQLVSIPAELAPVIRVHAGQAGAASARIPAVHYSDPANVKGPVLTSD